MISTKDIAGNWCCVCWGIGLGCSRFAKAQPATSDAENELYHRGFCFFNGLCASFDEKRKRTFIDDVPTNGFYKDGDPGNIDWYRSSNCVGNGCSCSTKMC